MGPQVPKSAGCRTFHRYVGTGLLSSHTIRLLYYIYRLIIENKT